MSEFSDSQDASIIEKLAAEDARELVDTDNDPFEYRFDYLGWPLIVRIVPHESGSLHMQLMGKVGTIPFSAEARERRIGAMMLLRSTRKRRPTRFALTRKGDVAIAGDVEVAAPVTPRTVITALTMLLASVKPYLDLFPLFLDTTHRRQH